MMRVRNLKFKCSDAVSREDYEEFNKPIFLSLTRVPLIEHLNVAYLCDKSHYYI